eukprot:1195003-Prorocentrum_minimum.AAC.1
MPTFSLPTLPQLPSWSLPTLYLPQLPQLPQLQLPTFNLPDLNSLFASLSMQPYGAAAYGGQQASSAHAHTDDHHDSSNQAPYGTPASRRVGLDTDI